LLVRRFRLLEEFSLGGQHDNQRIVYSIKSYLKTAIDLHQDMESELPHVILNISSPLDIAMSGHAERIGDPERGDSLPLFEEFSPIRRVLAAQKMKLGGWVVWDTREIFRPWYVPCVMEREEI
jgi:hypothetical protein